MVCTSDKKSRKKTRPNHRLTPNADELRAVRLCNFIRIPPLRSFLPTYVRDLVKYEYSSKLAFALGVEAKSTARDTPFAYTV